MPPLLIIFKQALISFDCLQAAISIFDLDVPPPPVNLSVQQTTFTRVEVTFDNGNASLLSATDDYEVCVMLEFC